MKNAEIGLDGGTVIPESGRFINARNILQTWDEYCGAYLTFPDTIAPNDFVNWVSRMYANAYLHLPEESWLDVFAELLPLSAPKAFVPRIVLDYLAGDADSSLPEIPKHKFGRYIRTAWADASSDDPDEILSRLATMMKNGDISGVTCQSYVYKTDIQYQQDGKEAEPLSRASFSRLIRRLVAKRDAHTYDDPPPSVPGENAFIPAVKTDALSVSHLDSIHDFQRLFAGLARESSAYVSLACTIRNATGGWDRGHAVIAGNLARMAKQLVEITIFDRTRRCSASTNMNYLTLETIVNVKYLISNFSQELIDDYVSQARGSSHGPWNGFSTRDRAISLGLDQGVIDMLDHSHLHIHGSWDDVQRFHLSETSDGRFLAMPLESSDGAIQALLGFSYWALEATRQFLELTGSRIIADELIASIGGLTDRLAEANATYKQWQAGAAP